MQQTTVLGLLQKVTDIDTLINNLTEADFDEKNISVVTNNQNDARKYVKHNGPLGKLELGDLSHKLNQLQVPQQTIKSYLEDVQKGAILIAIATEPGSANAAKEMLQDYNTQEIFIAQLKK